MRWRLYFDGGGDTGIECIVAGTRAATVLQRRDGDGPSGLCRFVAGVLVGEPIDEAVDVGGAGAAGVDGNGGRGSSQDDADCIAVAEGGCAAVDQREAHVVDGEHFVAVVGDVGHRQHHFIQALGGFHRRCVSGDEDRCLCAALGEGGVVGGDAQGRLGIDRLYACTSTVEVIPGLNVSSPGLVPPLSFNDVMVTARVACVGSLLVFS